MGEGIQPLKQLREFYRLNNRNFVENAQKWMHDLGLNGVVVFESELRQIFPCFMGDTDLILENYHQLPHSFDLKILKQF